MPRKRRIPLRRLAITVTCAALAAFAAMNTINESNLNTFVLPRAGTPVAGFVAIDSRAQVDVYCVTRGGRILRISGLASTPAHDALRRRWLIADGSLKTVEPEGPADISGGHFSPPITTRDLWMACGMPPDDAQLDAAARDLDLILHRLQTHGPAGYTYPADSEGLAIHTGLEVLRPCYPRPGQAVSLHVGFLMFFLASSLSAVGTLVYTVIGAMRTSRSTPA